MKQRLESVQVEKFGRMNIGIWTQMMEDLLILWLLQEKQELVVYIALLTIELIHIVLHLNNKLIW